MNDKQLKTIGLALAGVIALVIVILLGKRLFEGLDKLLNGLGITDSEEEKKAAADIEKAKTAKTQINVSPFDANFYKQKGIIKLKSKAGAEILASDIKKAQNTVFQFGDDYWSAIEKAFGYMTYKSHVSQVSDAFRRLYGEDLLQWLTRLANYESEKQYLAQILNRVNNLPKGDK